MSEPTYSREQIEGWQTQLEEIAELPRTSFTKKQAVEELLDSIEKALTTRSYAEVADALKADGLDISVGSLKQYVSRLRQSKGVNKSKRKRPSTSRRKKELPEGRSQTSRQKKASTRKATKTKSAKK